MLYTIFRPALPGRASLAPPLSAPSMRGLTLALISTTLLGGCASLSPDGGFDPVQSAARSHLQQDVVWTRDDASRNQARSRVDALLAQPLSAEQAVQVALLNNPALQATFYKLGIAEADYTALVEKAKALGYDTSKLRKVPQQWPETAADARR